MQRSWYIIVPIAMGFLGLSGGAVNSFAFMPVADFQSPEGHVILRDVLEANHSSPAANPRQKMEYDFVRSVILSADKSSVAYFMYAAQGNLGADGSYAKDVTRTMEAGKFITVAASLFYPLSRGSAHIRSNSIVNKPAIDPRYLSHPLGMEIHATHLRSIQTIVATEPLTSFVKPHGRRSPAFAKIGPD